MQYEIKARNKVVAVKGKTGNPGVRNPKKKSSTSFAVLGDEPKGRMMGFRPLQSLEEKIDKAVAASGLKHSDWLMQAAIAYLEKSPAEAGQQLEQGQLSSDDSSRTEEPAAATSNEAPASRSSNTSRKEDQASNAETSSKSKRSPRTGAKTRKATTG